MVAQKRRELERKRVIMESRIAAIREEFSAEEDEMNILICRDIDREDARSANSDQVRAQRFADT